MDLLARLIEQHGWHVMAELAALAIFGVFSAVYLTALLRGRVRAIACPACGRVASRADARCPRCREPLRSA
jgi:predicted amidophosphoribosyltransferase